MSCGIITCAGFITFAAVRLPGYLSKLAPGAVQEVITCAPAALVVFSAASLHSQVWQLQYPLIIVCFVAFVMSSINFVFVFLLFFCWLTFCCHFFVCCLPLFLQMNLFLCVSLQMATFRPYLGLHQARRHKVSMAFYMRRCCPFELWCQTDFYLPCFPFDSLCF